jgi:hypothetical protein
VTCGWSSARCFSLFSVTASVSRPSATGPGTPYRASAGAATSPDCGHRYTRTSADRPGARYTVTATTIWTITWRV